MSAPGRLLSTGSVIVDAPMTVPHLPERGGDVLATAHPRTPGGGFNVVVAAARLGAGAGLLSRLGDGENGRLCAAALRAEGVDILLPPVPGEDTGLCIALIEPDGERTFITTAGVEAIVLPEQLAGIRLHRADIVYVSGYDLCYPLAGPALAEWAAGIAPGPRIVLDPGPLVAQIPEPILDAALSRTDVLSLNEREAALLASEEIAARNSAGDGDPGPAYTTILNAVRRRTRREATIVIRLGPAGCLVDEAGAHLQWCPAPLVDAVDTTGAGDAHTGAMIAGLLGGLDLASACRRANHAAAITVTRYGPATSPTLAEMDSLT